MTVEEEVGRRMVVAHIFLMSQIGMRVTLKELADRVSKEHKKRTFTFGQISEYQKGRVGQPLDLLAAYARATLTDPGWLAFGEDTNATPPAGHLGVPDTPLTPAPRPRRTKKSR